MQTIQAIAAEAFAHNPGFTTKDQNEAIALATEMQADAAEDETYEVRAYQGGRFIVVMLVDGEVEFVL